MARILLVDDDPAVRRGLVRFLARHGHDIEEASDGLQALEALEANEWNLVITDLNMPEATGIEILTTVADTRPELPVIAMSGGGLMHKSQLLEDATALGAFASIEKPIELEDLLRLVDRALEERG